MNTTTNGTNAQGCRTTKDYDVDIFALQNVRTREKHANTRTKIIQKESVIQKEHRDSFVLRIMA